MLSNIYLGSYAILWIVITTLFIYNKKTIGIGGFLLIIYSISSLASIIYFNALDGILKGEAVAIEKEPLFFLFFCLNICMLPIYIHSEQLTKLKIHSISSQEISFIKIILSFFAPFIIEAFLEMIYVASTIKTNELQAIYSSDDYEISNKLSFIGRYTTWICRRLVYVWPILFFYLFINKDNRKYSYLALTAFFVNILYSYSNAARVGIVKLIFLFIIVFLLFKNNMNAIMRKKIIKSGLIISILFIIMLALITISRYSSMKTGLDLIGWISLYLGESHINFCQYIWDLNNTSEGDNMFSMAKTLIGMDAITDLDLRREHWSGVLGIPTHIFYSWVGDLYLDLGRLATLFFCILFSIFLELYIRKILRNKTYSLLSIFVMSMSLLILLFGFMYFPYKTYNQQILILYSIAFLIICRIYSKTSKKY